MTFLLLCLIYDYMGYVSTRKTRLQNQLTRVQARLENLYEIILEMSETGVSSYAFDSGEGSQRTTRRSLTEIQDMIDRLEAQERHLINELNRMGIVSIRLRRKG